MVESQWKDGQHRQPRGKLREPQRPPRHTRRNARGTPACPRHAAPGHWDPAAENAERYSHLGEGFGAFPRNWTLIPLQADTVSGFCDSVMCMEPACRWDWQTQIQASGDATYKRTSLLTCQNSTWHLERLPVACGYSNELGEWLKSLKNYTY